MNKTNHANHSLSDLGRGGSSERKSVDDLIQRSSSSADRSGSDFSKSLAENNTEAPERPKKKNSDRTERSSDRSERSASSADRSSKDNAASSTDKAAEKATEKTRAEKRFAQRKAERERARASASEETNSAEEQAKNTEPTIGRITKVLGRGSMAIARSEAIALASGNIDRLNASEIPTIMTENTFLNNAMASEPGDFLNEKMTVADLLNQLDLDEEVIKAAESFGVDMGEMISPKDFFKIIGIDPHVVSAQISSLKSELPKNGFTNLMNQAANDAVAEDLKKDPAAAVSGDANMMAASASDINDAKTASPNPADTGSGGVQITPEEAAQHMNRDVTGQMVQSPDAAISPKVSSEIRSDVALSNKEAMSSPNTAAPFGVEQTKIDPFEKLGQKLKFAKVETTGQQQNQLQQNVLSAADELSRLKHSGLDIAKPLTIKDRLAAQTTDGEQSNFVGNINNVLSNDALKPTGGLSSGFGGGDFSGQGFTSEELIENIEQNLEIPADEASDMLSSDSLRFDNRASGEKVLSTGASIEGATTAADAPEIMSTRTAADRAKIAESVMDKARLLLTKGGGSMAFQMKIDNSEVIDIAIKLSGNQVSLRLGDSGGLGERLAAELGGLEASLKSQNLELTGVEVATNTDTDPQGQQNSGNSGFDQGQNEQSFASDESDDFSTFMSEVAESTEASVDEQSQPRSTPRPNTSGRISVAV